LILLKQYNLHKKIRLNTNVTKAKWEQDAWLVTLDNKEEVKSKILINATGPLSTAVTPNIEGLNTFGGVSFHFNHWQNDIELNNKNVVIVGSGASAVQIIPAILDSVNTLHVAQRSPHWVLPKANFKIPSVLVKLFAKKPIYTLIRWFIYWMPELRVIAFKYSPRALVLISKGPAMRRLKNMFLIKTYVKS
jgi:cation diffusion facilitator CzcD-associated flavoprotein CzcO